MFNGTVQQLVLEVWLAMILYGNKHWFSHKQLEKKPVILYFWLSVWINLFFFLSKQNKQNPTANNLSVNIDQFPGIPTSTNLHRNQTHKWINL